MNSITTKNESKEIIVNNINIKEKKSELKDSKIQNNKKSKIEFVSKFKEDDAKEIKRNEIIKNINTLFESINKIQGSGKKEDMKKVKKYYKNIFKLIKKLEKIKLKRQFSALPNDLIIELNGVYKYYTSPTMTTMILKNIDLVVNKGDFVVILGPSGSGKTTLMNLISGIDKPTYGQVNVAGFELHNLSNKNLTSFRKDVIGYVFQRYGLLPNLTVFENVLMGSYLGKDTYSEQKFKEGIDRNVDAKNFYSGKENEIISKIIDTVGLTEQTNKYPYELSGGQKQRTSIARTIAKNPLIIFGDEPTAAVDEKMSKAIIDSFVRINDVLKTTIVMITHDERIANYANRVVYLLDGVINKVVEKQRGEVIFDENKKA
ncbi:ABC transporter ATP-binding protein [Malacoplasma iowae]|uniref:ABC exporter ATP-binding subunit n=1 Tax=Malacoplasma iowae DK-CPA TaxID=1394179 RepID=A0A084U3C2_MALIO|nr:ABC transporter ATP-binding protein [Malacoplasma iowae]KFB07458.1 ABC exporter ATP-binding subunit [Malacoplasma iowae DK-CPA]WPL36633.1 ABC transporter ATP-binding protein [Malacoplasma iowae]WPL37859.1 ABC transporter ATP-binding protein [Malacoplasma iowae]WPL41250.1 ABC transporter ATP-binding protein [Malacoplasma iowae]